MRDRLLLGLTFVLFGGAIARTGLVYRWLGVIGVLAGLVYAAIGVAVGYSGLGPTPGDLPVTVLFVVFMVACSWRASAAMTPRPARQGEGVRRSG